MSGANTPQGRQDFIFNVITLSDPNVWSENVELQKNRITEVHFCKLCSHFLIMVTPMMSCWLTADTGCAITLLASDWSISLTEASDWSDHLSDWQPVIGVSIMIAKHDGASHHLSLVSAFFSLLIGQHFPVEGSDWQSVDDVCFWERNVHRTSIRSVLSAIGN